MCVHYVYTHTYYGLLLLYIYRYIYVYIYMYIYIHTYTHIMLVVCYDIALFKHALAQLLEYHLCFSMFMGGYAVLSLYSMQS